MGENPRVLWVARDSDCEVWIHDAPPIWNGGAWGSTSIASKAEDDDFCPGLQPGECRMFIEFAPMRATENDDGLCLRWSEKNAEWTTASSMSRGLVYIPMPPDPTPYLTQADPKKAARREEIRAQITALQAELEGMEG